MNPEIKKEMLDALHARCADRPAHAKYLAALEAAIQDCHNDDARLLVTYDALDDKRPSGVSRRVAEALIDDLLWIERDEPTAGYFRDVFPNAYRDVRRSAMQRAATARRSRSTKPIEELL